MNNKIPCGHCDSGTYCVIPVLHGLSAFGNCKSTREALKKAPRCKHDDKHICYGARDWIAATQFPLTENKRKEIFNACFV